MISSIVFHYSLYSPTSISWYSQITSALNFSSHSTYTFLSFNIRPFSSFYFSFLSIFTFVYSIFSTAFITLLFFASHFLISSSRSISSITTFVICIVLIFSHFFLLILYLHYFPLHQSASPIIYLGYQLIPYYFLAYVLDKSQILIDTKPIMLVFCSTSGCS